MQARSETKKKENWWLTPISGKFWLKCVVAHPMVHCHTFKLLKFRILDNFGLDQKSRLSILLAEDHRINPNWNNNRKKELATTYPKTKFINMLWVRSSNGKIFRLLNFNFSIFHENTTIQNISNCQNEKLLVTGRLCYLFA